MSDGTEIQWTDATWNPTTGCTKVSPGCAHCYIERTPAFRIHGRKFVNGATDLQLHANRLDQPLRWRKPRRVFVNSLSDLFHDDVPAAFIDQVFAAMALSPDHTFQVLTKRPTRMLAYMSAEGRHDAIVAAMDMPAWLPAGRRFLRVPENWPLPNVWLGVSVENQHFADERIPLLLQTPAAIRFISAEPLLGPVDIRRAECASGEPAWIDWVIVGGESGPGARPFNIAWARSILAECQEAGVACFVKQLGANVITTWQSDFQFRDKKGGDMAEWPADLRVRQFPVADSA